MLALAFASVGELLARRRSENPIGWLLLAAGLISAIGRFEIAYATYVLLTRPGSLPGGIFAAWSASWLWGAVIGILFNVFLIFPTGYLPSAAWRTVGWFVAGAFALMTFGLMFRLGPRRFTTHPIWTTCWPAAARSWTC